MSAHRIGPTATPVTASPSAVNCTSGSWATSTSVTLDAGTWLVCYGGAFGTSASGYRQLYFGTSATNGRWTPSAAAASGDQTRLACSTVVTPTAATTYSLYARQNSGSTLQFHGYVSAIRIS